MALRTRRAFGECVITAEQQSERTFGEMQPAQKEQISHRKNAFSKLSKQCFSIEPKAKKFKSR